MIRFFITTALTISYLWESNPRLYSWTFIAKAGWNANIYKDNCYFIIRTVTTSPEFTFINGAKCQSPFTYSLSVFPVIQQLWVLSYAIVHVLSFLFFEILYDDCYLFFI